MVAASTDMSATALAKLYKRQITITYTALPVLPPRASILPSGKKEEMYLLECTYVQ